MLFFIHRYMNRTLVYTWTHGVIYVYYIALCIINDSIDKNSNIIMKSSAAVYTIIINNEYVSRVLHNKLNNVSLIGVLYRLKA